MPWTKIKLNDGTEIPGVAFGTWHTGNDQQSIDQVKQALSVGFIHIDTAQAYRNETEAGQALKESGVHRSNIYITTKYSGLTDVETSIQNSLKSLGVSYVDLLLVHSPRLAKGDIPGLWKQFEDIQARGLAKSIGVSNFSINDLAILLKDAKVKPVVNQILFHPYVHAEHLPVLNYCHERDIVVEAYSPLYPLTHQAGGPLEQPLAAIRARTGATSEQILLAWNKTKGTVVLTASSKEWRLKDYLKAGDLKLKTEELRDLDAAGAAGSDRA